MGPTSMTEFQNFSRYSGLFNSTVLYWLKDTISGINFYFNIFDKSTGERIDLLNDDGETITGFTYGKIKRTERRKKSKITETGKIINFNPNRIAENT